MLEKTLKLGLISGALFVELLISIDCGPAKELAPEIRCFYMIKEARNHIHAGEADQAIVILKKALLLDPHSSEAHCKMADCLSMQHNFRASLVECEKTIKLNPRSSDAYYRKAVDLGALKNYPDSLKCFDKAIALKPENPNYYLGRAELYRAIKMPDKAIADLHTYLAIEPQNEHCRQMLKEIKSKNQAH